MCDNRIRQSIIEDLKEIQLSDKWQFFPDTCKDQFRDLKELWLNSPWGRIIRGKRVFVVLSFEGKQHSTWKLFVDDEFIREMSEISVHMGSGKDAMFMAEKEVL